MTTFLSNSFLRGLGIAATGGLLIGGPVMAGVRPPAERSDPMAVPAAAETSTTLREQAEQRTFDVPVASIPSRDPQLTATDPAAVTPATAPSAGANPAPAAPLIAQTYPLPVVKEGYSAKGWYLTIGAGYQAPSDQTVNSNGTLVSPFFSPLLYSFQNNNSTKLNMGGGFSGDVGVGYDFGSLRTELTYGYSSASFNSVSAVNPIGFGAFGLVPYTNNVSGSINKNDVLLSAYYDFHNDSRWTPYIGGGIGYSNISTPSVSFAGISSNSVNKGLFGWQAKLGVSYAVNYNSDVYLEGVYQGTGGYSTDNLTFDGFNSWGGKLGFRYRFGAKPVAAAPVPQPEPMVEPAPAPMPTPEPQPAPAPIRGLW